MPPVYAGSLIAANLSMQDLRAMHFMGNFEQIQDDFVVAGTVIANDSSDNFYKSIMLQDTTAGITLRMDANGLFSQFHTGDKLAIKLRGLWLGDYGKMLQLGIGVDRTDTLYPELTPIPVPLFDKYIVRLGQKDSLRAKLVRLEDLNDALQSCLVRIHNVEIGVNDTGKTYADAINKSSANRLLKVCGGGSIFLRNSGFSSFANTKLPRGNGFITAVYTVFNNEKQLMIRDTADVQLKGIRCTGTGAKQLLMEDFENGRQAANWLPNGWKNLAESGGRIYEQKLTGSNHFAEINAFATGLPLISAWLITPPINLSNSANEVLQFQTKDGFDNGGSLQVFISTNYDGVMSVSKAKWVALKSNIAKGTVSGIANTWVPSGNISLSGYTGKIYIAFRYDGADPPASIDKRTTTFQIDNIQVLGN